jgi:flagellar hook capping protein FlgD
LQRLLRTATLIALLVATAAAFVITEQLKLTLSPIYETKVSKVFSPTCGCADNHVNIRVRLRHADTAEVAMLDSRKRLVASIANRRVPRGHVTFRWAGITDAGMRAPDGVYYAQIHLYDQHRTIVLPNKIRLDTKPPAIVSVSQSRAAISPDGDGHGDVLRLRYQLSKLAHLFIYVGGRTVLGPTYRVQPVGRVVWAGRKGGRNLPPGTYTLEIGARDLAGNSTPPSERWRIQVEIRFIKLASRRIVTRPHAFFEIGVSTDAPRYRWKLGRRTATASGPLLRVRAPARPGRYQLLLSERGRSTRATVIVR